MEAKKRLVEALRRAGAPEPMIEYAGRGGYDDFESQSATPITDLVADCKVAGLTDIAQRAINGEFDASYRG